MIGTKPERRTRWTGDAGMTLVELMVSLVLVSTVVAIVAGGTMTAMRHMGSNAARLTEVSTNKVAIEAMAKTLRTAVQPKDYGNLTSTEAAIIDGNGYFLRFYAALTPLQEGSCVGQSHFGPAQLRYQLTADGTLTETYREPDLHACGNRNFTYTCVVGSANCLARTRVIARDLIYQPIFVYFDQTAAVISSLPLASSGQSSAVDAIDVALKGQTGRDETSSVVTRISLINPAPVCNPAVMTCTP